MPGRTAAADRTAASRVSYYFSADCGHPNRSVGSGRDTGAGSRHHPRPSCVVCALVGVTRLPARIAVGLSPPEPRGPHGSGRRSRHHRVTAQDDDGNALPNPAADRHAGKIPTPRRHCKIGTVSVASRRGGNLPHSLSETVCQPAPYCHANVQVRTEPTAGNLVQDRYTGPSPRPSAGRGS